MYRRPPNSIDGFRVRRQGKATVKPTEAPPDKLPVPERFMKTPTPTAAAPRRAAAAIAPTGVAPVQHHRLSRHDIDASLEAIDTEAPVRKRRRLITKIRLKVMMFVVLFAALLGGGYFGYKVLFASGSIFRGNIFSIFSNKSLQKDANGRSNIVLFGTSEDDPSHADAGAELTDSIMVLSVDQTSKNAVMFSVPRDLWVDYGGACSAGYQGKINAVYECGKQGASEQAGADKLRGVVGQAFGLDIQYYAKVNYSALRQAVDAVGGITVMIESDDSRGVMDTNFDWTCGKSSSERVKKCPPRGHLVDFPNGPANLDGEHALGLARARNVAGGYGLSAGNFDREQYQQKILLAIKDKAISAGTIANPAAVSKLIDSLGDNIRTNFETSEIKTLIDLTSSIKKESIKTISLVDPKKPLVTTGDVSGQSIVRPVAGLKDFSDIKAYIQAELQSGGTTSESYTIDILNGTDGFGQAGRKRDELAQKGIIVTGIGDAPVRESYGTLQWFDLSGGTKPTIAKKLTEALGEGSSGSTLPDGVKSTANFVIIVGNGAN